MQNNELLSLLEGELNLSTDKRDTGASDISLHSAISLLQRADKIAGAGPPPRAKDILDVAAHR